MSDSLAQLQRALSDRYEVRSEIGSGGMATIFRARDLKHERDVALKVFRPEVAELLGSERFFREIRIAAKLTHPHILPLHDSGQADGLLYYVMPLVEGESLRTRLAASRQLPVAEAVRIAGQVASALDYAHRQGIVHRDIKPENILLHEGQALVADFGIALAVHAAGAERLTQTGLFIGTPTYMSPEQATGDPTLDGRSDVYSLACVLHEMLCGKPPFTGPSAQAIVAQLLTERPPDVRACRENVPENVATAVRVALSKVPADRQHTAGEFAEDLVRPEPAVRSAGTRFHPAWYAVIAGVVTLGSVGIAYLAMRGDGNRVPARLDRLTMIVSTDGTAEQPALSPDGKLIAYVASEHPGGPVDLYVRLVRGGQPVRLTSDDASESAPVFSPDGERLAFTRRGAGGGPPAIWLIPALGGDAVPLVDGAGLPAWAPRGDELAVVLGAGAPSDRIARVGLDGVVRAIVFENASPYLAVRRISWSPDGKQIAMARSRGGASSELWMVDAEGGPARPLLQDSAAVVNEDPAFMPDGRSIVYSSSRAGTMNLWTVSVEGRAPEQLTSGAGPDAWPSVSANGAIAYSNSRWRNSLVTYDPATGNSATLTTHTPYLWAPAFAPDGREVAYSRGDVDGTWSIWIVPVQGGAARRLTAQSEPTIYPRFTPDGRSVIYFTWTAVARIWKVPRGGGPPEPLTPAGSDASYGDLSPDGQQLAFARTEDGVTRIYIAPIAGNTNGGTRRLTNSPSTLPRWSPDGKWIAFTADRGYDSGIWVIRPDGTGGRRLTSEGGWPTWWPDGSRIGYITFGGGRQQSHAVTFPGGRSLPLDLPFAAHNSPFDVSPDGGTIATTNATHLADEIWMREGAP